jgi:hypothetical protein
VSSRAIPVFVSFLRIEGRLCTKRSWRDPSGGRPMRVGRSERDALRIAFDRIQSVAERRRMCSAPCRANGMVFATTRRRWALALSEIAGGAARFSPSRLQSGALSRLLSKGARSARAAVARAASSVASGAPSRRAGSTCAVIDCKAAVAGKRKNWPPRATDQPRRKDAQAVRKRCGVALLGTLGARSR